MTVGVTPVTVVHVMEKVDRGGVETVALDLCRTIPVTEVQQIVLTMGDGEGRLAQQFRTAGAQVRRCPLRPVPTYPLRLWKYLRLVRPQAVVSYVSLVSGLVLMVAAAAGVPVRVARMNSDSDGKPNSPRRGVQRALLRVMLRHCATDILGNTAAGVAFTAPRPGDRRCRVLVDGVDFRRFSRTRMPRHRRQGPPLFVHIGRAAPEKNRAFLLRVHADVQNFRTGTRLKFVGPGGTADLDAVDPLVSTNPLVELAGETDHVEDVLADCDVLLLPSLREGVPGVVLEALSMGVPVLASNLAGMRELTRQVDGVTLLPLDAGPLVWAQTALRLAEMPASERDEISHRVQESQFALEYSAAQWKSVWTSRR